MIELLEILTLVCLSIPVYVYVGYPLVLFILNVLLPGKLVDKQKVLPKTTLIVSCYNEEDIIERKILNCLEIAYPADKLDFLFVSDGSTDGTDDIIKQYTGGRLKLIRQEGRLGKTMGLNKAVPESESDIIIFSDANAMYEKNAIRELVSNFGDKDVGYVVGAALYRDDIESSAAISEDRYWQYEMTIKKIESRLHSVVGGDGAIYAIRKSLYQTLDREEINDFSNPLQIIRRGYRGVFEPEAICYEQTAGNFSKEATRKERIVNRSFSAVMKNRVLLNPFRFGFFSFELWSHKFLRWLCPFFIISSVIGTLVLASLGVELFQVILLCMIIFIWSVLLGYLLRDRSAKYAVFMYPYYFYLVNVSSMLGVIHALRGSVQVTWDTARSATDGVASKNATAIVAFCSVLVVTTWLFLTMLLSLLENYG